MTETRIIVDLDREATPDQIMTLQDGVETSIDHVVGDVLVPDRGYAGLVATYAGTVVTIGTGRLYNGGKVYAYDTAGTFDCLTKLPVATKKIMLLVAYGTEADTDVAPVSYLVESLSTPTAPVYKPQTVATTHKRLAVVQDAYGDEAPNPVQPGTGLALPIAVAVLGPTGIVSLVNIVDGKVPVLADIARRTAALEAFEATIGPEVSTLAATLAGLANAPNNQAAIGRIFLALADLNAKEGIPTDAADASADYLLDGTNSDLAHPLSNCKVMEGIRFADDGAADAVLDRFNPFDTASVVMGGVLFPAYDSYVRQTTGPATGNVIANAYTYQNVTYTQKTMARSRVRYGSEFTVCSNSSFWASGSYDPISGIFQLPDGETFRASVDITDTTQTQYTNGIANTHLLVRLQEFWTDTVSETYWDSVVQAPQTVPGFHLAESFLNGQAFWLPSVGFTLTALDAQGDVTVMLCQAGANAQPDPSAVLASVTLPYAQLVVGKNVAPFATPVLVEAGQVAVIIATTGSHRIATTDGPSFPQGTFFVLSQSGYAQGDLTKHLCLDFYSMKFRQSVLSVQLKNLQLAGGITAIDILAGTVVPASTALTYEIQLGGVWVPLNGVTTSQLNAGGALNPNIPLRATFAGTPDMMPCIDLAHSNAHVSRPKTSLAHVWPKLPRTPPVPTSQVRVIERYESYDPAQHSWAGKLLTGAGYLTQTPPSSYSDVLGTNGSLERTYVYNLGAAVTSYKALTLATALSPLDVDHGAWIKDYVL